MHRNIFGMLPSLNKRLEQLVADCCQKYSDYDEVHEILDLIADFAGSEHEKGWFT